ncbi:MAG: hypothetical protein HKN87_01230 [Saprospiraceae bacterium]|nr:hypothetical protein [Saprospiraceae bacterium]
MRSLWILESMNRSLCRIFVSCSMVMMLYINLSAQGDVIGTITIESGDYERYNTPVYADISHFNLNASDSISLVEVVDGQRHLISSQIDRSDRTILWWIVHGKTSRQRVRHYEIVAGMDGESKSMESTDNTMTLIIKQEETPVFAYQYGKAPVPEGVSEIFSRAGYIHPLWSPAGQILTRIQPPDHYHHYGIWNPWTHTEYKGREVDFWNLAKDQGRVDVSGKPAVNTGSIYGEISTVHRHIVHADSQYTKETEVLREELSLRAWNIDPGQRAWLVDVSSTLNCSSSDPLTIKAYRYQGFGFRARENWNDENLHMLTSEGYDKSTGNATRAKWCKVSGPTDNGMAGISFMTHPENYNYPEQLRIWPTGANEGEENVFVNFNPAQDRDWIIHPGKDKVLKYRMLVYDGTIDSLTAERYWHDFAHPPSVQIQKLTPLQGKRILVYTRNGEGYRHENIPFTIKALTKLGTEHGFAVDATEDAGVFTPANLARYDALIFSNTNNKIFDTEGQRTALQSYIRKGGGFVGIHIASGSERDWPWYWKMIGGTFFRHPKKQVFSVDVVDKAHPSTYFLPERWETKDECYFHKHYNPTAHVLLTADLATVEDDKKEDYPGDTFGNALPIAWCNTFDGGRQWFTALGHDAERYEDPQFMRHILGGIQWVIE